MIDIESKSSDVQCFILRPNCSLSWRGNLIFFLAMCVLLMLIAVWFSAHGFWLVLPFAGLELAVLGTVLYLVSWRAQQCEVISIDNDAVCIEKGYRYPQKQWVLTRIWARVVLEHCHKQWYPSRLLIRSHGRAVEIGKFLNEDERRRLAAELAQSI